MDGAADHGARARRTIRLHVSTSRAASIILHTPWSQFGPLDSWPVYILLGFLSQILDSNPPSQRCFDLFIKNTTGFEVDHTNGAYPNGQWRDFFYFLRRVAWTLVASQPLSMALWRWGFTLASSSVFPEPRLVKVVATSAVLSAGMIAWKYMAVLPSLAHAPSWLVRAWQKCVTFFQDRDPAEAPQVSERAVAQH
ncbi:hypothetical protein IFR04_008314 [Cadophora malorum]|uniref:Uncharacterized protein n=1 Tax=Cadophora malorum TaxID=108018 RepID=A0A8H7W5M5_9HELO|nr:hypothetical protein IFR04_008314 [Cadophora malorum]